MSSGKPLGWITVHDTSQSAPPFKSDPEAGVVFTKPRVVEFCLDLLGMDSLDPRGHERILDVGCGYGQFIGEVADRFFRKSHSIGLGAEEALERFCRSVTGVENNSARAEKTREVLRETFGRYFEAPPSVEDLENVVITADFLDWEPTHTGFTRIVGNLPYVRYSAIPTLETGLTIETLRKRFPSFNGRADYSIAFLDRILELLNQGGVAGVITSNRFTRSQYGVGLRRRLSREEYHVNEVDLSRVAAFTETVSAYASFFTLDQRDEQNRYIELTSLREAGLKRLLSTGVQDCRTSREYYACSRGNLPADGSPWSPLPLRIQRVLRRLERKGSPAAESYHVRKGPASGADGVFVREKDEFPFSPDSASTFLLPTTERPPIEARRGCRKFFLRVYEPNTRHLVALDSMPEDVQAYLQANRAILEERYVVQNTDRQWWETIDKYDPALAQRPKIIVRDLGRGEGVWIDEGHGMPLHPSVYISGENSLLPFLAGALQSPLGDLYRLWKSPPLRGRSLRASSRMLRRFPLPTDIPRVHGTQPPKEGAIKDAYGIDGDDWEALERVHSRFFGVDAT